MKNLFYLMVFLLFAAQVQAATRWVDNICTNGLTTYNPSARTCITGTDTVYSTIANGIAATTSPGDILNVRSGTYAEKIDDAFITMTSGTAANRIVIKSYDGPRAAIIRPSGVPGAAIGTRGHNYLTFDGFKLDCANLADDSACLYNGGGTTGNYFWNFEVTMAGAGACNSSTPSGGCGEGVAAFGNNAQYVGCEVHNIHVNENDSGGNSGHGFYLNGSGSLVDNCYIHDVGGQGIQVYKSGSVSENNNIIRNSRWQNTRQSSGSGLSAILLGNGSNNVAYGNIVYGSNHSGIQAGNACTDCAIYNNTIYGVTNQALELYSGSTRPVVKNNIVSNSGTTILDNGASSPAVSNNLCSSTCSMGTGNLTEVATSTFINPGTDFHLKAGSLAIDAGTPGITIGVTVPACSPTITANCYNGSNPDIGALEAGTPSSGGPPTLTPNLTTVAAGAAILLTVDDDDVNERVESRTDWVGTYIPGTAAAAALDWFYMNGTKTAPATAISDAVIPFTAPSTPGSYEFRFYANEAGVDTLLATTPFTVVVPGIVMKFNVSSLKIGPSVTWKIGTP